MLKRIKTASSDEAEEREARGGINRVFTSLFK